LSNNFGWFGKRFFPIHPIKKRRHPRRRWRQKFRLSSSCRIRSSAARRKASSCSGTGKCAPQTSQATAAQGLSPLHQAQRFRIAPSTGACAAASISPKSLLPGLGLPGSHVSGAEPPQRLVSGLSCMAPSEATDPSKSSRPQTPQKRASRVLLAPQ